jgi:hypothetical protein
MAAGRLDMVGAEGQRTIRLDHITGGGKRHMAAIGGGAIAFCSDAHDQS